MKRDQKISDRRMPSALQRKIGRHNPLCAASRLGIQAMASLPKATRAEFSHQYFLVAARTCLQIFRFVIGARRSVSGQTSFNRGCHGSSGKLNFPGKPKLVRFLRSQWQPVVREGAVTPLLVRGVCRFKPRGIVYLCTKSGPNHTRYTNLTK